MNYTLGYYLLPHPPIIIPEVGRGEEIKINQSIRAFQTVSQEIRILQPETIVIITPHGVMFRDAISISLENQIEGNLSRFRAKEINIKKEIDIELTKEIIKKAKKENIDTIEINSKNLNQYHRQFELDHGTIVPLYFIEQKYQNYQLVHITYSPANNLELFKFGTLIKESINQLKRKSVIIASGDLSHCLTKDGAYPYSPKGKIFDNTFIDYLQKGDVINIMQMDKKLINEAKECGFLSVLILLGTINTEFKGTLLSYEGPFGVGYGIIKFEPNDSNINYLKILEGNKKSKMISNEYVRLAKTSIEYYLENQKLMNIPTNLSDRLLNKQAGVFVSLKKHGHLRGCVGTFLPTTSSIAQEIINNSIEAAFSDPRFKPLKAPELNDIDISVDILNKPQAASKDELNPKEYGVIVTFGHKRGLLLPNLEGIDTVDEQLRAVCEKANIPLYSDFKIQKFSVKRYYEDSENE